MTPLPVNPTVVALTDDKGNVKRIATNVDPETNVLVTQDQKTFDEAALGKPFNFAPTAAN